MMRNSEQENFITRLNYNERVKGTVALGFFFSSSLLVRSFDKGRASVPTPEFMLGRTSDVFAGAVQASLCKILFGSKRTWLNSLFGFGANGTSELYQKYGIETGTYDPGDFVAFGIGAFAWAAFDSSAKLLYSSGITKPLYKWLHIKDRRVFEHLPNTTSNTLDNKIDHTAAMLKFGGTSKR